MKTHFSDPDMLLLIATDPIDMVVSAVYYFLYDTSTEVMVRLGVPSNEDVQEWINALSNRADSDDIRIQDCIAECCDYMKE